jgi:hypothetical protein
MLLGELLTRKENVKQQIDELNNHLMDVDMREKVNEVISDLFELHDKLQSYKVAINNVNNNNKIKVSKSDVSITNAIHLRQTTKMKIDILTNLISNLDRSLSISNLMEQRNNLLEEYILLDNAINGSNWSIEVE